MKIYYSASRAGFFSPEVHVELPADAVKISATRHAQLLAAQDQGGRIVPGPDGRPKIEHPVTTPAQRRNQLVSRVKRETRRRIERISPPWRQLNDLREPTPAAAARFVAIDAIRTASATIEELVAAAKPAALDQFPVRNHPIWPEFD